MLGLPHQPRRVVFNRKNYHERVRDRFGGIQDVQAHGVGRCLVQDQGEGIELHHLTKPAGQLLEQRGHIAVRDDRFRNGQQGSVRVGSGSCLPVEAIACHGENPGQSRIRNHQVGNPLRVSTSPAQRTFYHFSGFCINRLHSPGIRILRD